MVSLRANLRRSKIRDRAAGNRLSLKFGIPTSSSQISPQTHAGCSGGQGRNVAAQSSSHTGDCGGDTQITNRATRGPLQLDGNETLPLE